MGSYIHQHQQQFVLADLIYEEQISFDMTFPIRLQFAVQLMIFIGRRQFLALGKHVDRPKKVFLGPTR